MKESASQLNLEKFEVLKDFKDLRISKV